MILYVLKTKIRLKYNVWRMGCIKVIVNSQIEIILKMLRKKYGEEFMNPYFTQLCREVHAEN